MSSEAISEYRHKKFDLGKRVREDDSISSEISTNSIALDLSDSSKTSTYPSSDIHPKKQRRITKAVQSAVRSGLVAPIHNELHQRFQRVKIDQSSSTPAFLSSPRNTTNYQLSKGTIIAESDNRVVIKTEIIESSPANNESSIPLKRSRIPSTTIKTESHQSSSDLKDLNIKKELIEINAHLPAIPKEAYEEICKFRSNMVRKFPKKERSVKEQERRDKNTYACRKSRRVKKIEQVAVEEEYKNFKEANLKMTEYALRAAAYFKELMKMTVDDAASEIIVVD